MLNSTSPLGFEKDECLLVFVSYISSNFTIYLHVAWLFQKVLWTLLSVKLPQLESVINGEDGTWCYKSQCRQLFLWPNIARWSRKHSEKSWRTGRTLFAERECLKCRKLCTFNLPPWKVNAVIIVLFAVVVFNLHSNTTVVWLLSTTFCSSILILLLVVSISCRLLADILLLIICTEGMTLTHWAGHGDNSKFVFPSHYEH